MSKCRISFLKGHREQKAGEGDVEENNMSSITKDSDTFTTKKKHFWGESWS